MTYSYARCPVPRGLVARRAHTSRSARLACEPKDALAELSVRWEQQEVHSHGALKREAVAGLG
jgi:hypothetical protein